MSVETLLLFAGGLALLTAGAEFLVRGASRLAAIAGISPLVIGLTVVAYGTSSPEMAVSVKSALAGQADISLGNVVGSNIFNVLFILGVCAVILPLKISQRLVWLDVPIMIAVSVLVLVIGIDGKISWIDGVIWCAGMITHTVWRGRQNMDRRDVHCTARHRGEFPLFAARRIALADAHVVIRESYRSAYDLARRAFTPSLPISLGFAKYRCPLNTTSARLYLTDLISPMKVISNVRRFLLGEHVSQDSMRSPN